MIEFQCPTCGMNHTAPDASTGQSFNCQVCSQLVKIPAPDRPSAAPGPRSEAPRAPRLRDDSDDDRGPRPRRDERDRDDDDRDYRDRDYHYPRTRRYRGDFHKRRNFTDNAVLCLLMYIVLYPVGFVLNLTYLGEARAYQRETGERPEGRGCLLALLLVFFFVPLSIGVIAIACCMLFESAAPTPYTPIAPPTPNWTPPARVGPSMGPLPIHVVFRKNAVLITNNDRRPMHITIVGRNDDGEQVVERDIDPFGSLEIPSTEWFFEQGQTVKFWNRDYDLLELRVP